MDLWEIENRLYGEGVACICGVDEAGRGPLAGPVCAAAVILPRGLVIRDLNDSKKLSAKKRDYLFDEITEKAVSFGIAFSDVGIIEEYNILNATLLAMNEAIEKLDIAPDIALIDGDRDKGIAARTMCIVGGDGKSANIAAASILAKVTRDRYMTRMSELYPMYGFDAHKGYGTKLHFEALLEYGPCPIHRLSFLKSLYSGAHSRED
jgi:ribonuclease HII